MVYGLMSYNYTTNLGNEVQSIASRQFLPEDYVYVEHEKLDTFKYDQKVKLIMNGWFLDCPTAWPPSEDIDPLLISMHFTTNTNEQRLKTILSSESKEFLRNYGPVGCRDEHTVDFLKSQDIDAYFSGCLTLTLDSGKKDEIDEEYKQEPYIIVVSEIKDEIIDYLKDKTDKKIYFIQQDMFPNFDKSYYPNINTKLYNLSSFYNYKDKFFMAENILRLYENADAVITDRLHCLLPSIALKTPVLHLNNRGMRERFNGLNQLFDVYSFDEYKANYDIFDVDNPPKNSDAYLKIRKNLIKKCKQFTGYHNSSYKTDMSIEELRKTYALLLSKTNYAGRQYMLNSILLVKDYTTELSKFKNDKFKQEVVELSADLEEKQNEIDKLNEEINRLKNKDRENQNTIDNLKSDNEKKNNLIEVMKESTSWKITKPFRNLTDQFRKD